MGITDNPNDPRLGRGGDKEPGPQNEVYLVLSEEERAKGFIRPLRRTYIHVGPRGPKYPLRDLTPQEQERYAEQSYAKYEPYPEGGPALGRFWRQADLDNLDGGCGAATTMMITIAETYAREPQFYGYTYCVRCSKHLPVDEFRWEDGSTLGS